VEAVVSVRPQNPEDLNFSGSDREERAGSRFENFSKEFKLRECSGGIAPFGSLERLTELKSHRRKVVEQRSPHRWRESTIRVVVRAREVPGLLDLGEGAGRLTLRQRKILGRRISVNRGPARAKTSCT
jgi:hypothetical protein